MTITLAQARTILDAILEEARVQQAQPLAIIILDAGAHPVTFAREDGASLFRVDRAKAKAAGALGMGADTRVIATRAASNPSCFQSVVAVTGGQLALSPGGVIIRDLEGRIIGAVGTSGDTGDMDEACAIAGIAAAGLIHGEAK